MSKQSQQHTDGTENSDAPRGVAKEREGLFREEVLENKKSSFWGKVTIINKVSYLAWSIAFASVAVALILFVSFASYSKHRQARGILLPKHGLIHFYAQGAGVVRDCYVKLGDKVSKGQDLYHISTEYHGRNQFSDSNTQQIEALQRQIELQKNRLQMYRDSAERYRRLLDKHYVSLVEYQRYYDEYLHNEIALQDLEQKLVQLNVSRSHVIKAPADGTVSNLVAVVGDRVTVDKPLGSIVPAGDELQAVLYVQNKDIGFVEMGQKILLRYDAFPYQNYGMYEATVNQIDESMLSPKELDLPLTLDPKVPYVTNEPFCRVIATLKRQTIMAHGKEQHLHAGTTFTGDIVGDRRKIWQWILEPIYTLRGSLMSHGER